jgi:hypothetical protein
LDQLGAIPIAKFGCTALLFMKIADWNYRQHLCKAYG